jgi:hypothetical protein
VNGTHRYLADLYLRFLVVNSCSTEGFLLLLPPVEHHLVLAQIQIGGEIDDGNLEYGFCPGRRVLSSVEGPAKDPTPPNPASASCHLSCRTCWWCLGLDNRGGRGLFDLFDRLRNRSMIALIG